MNDHSQKDLENIWESFPISRLILQICSYLHNETISTQIILQVLQKILSTKIDSKAIQDNLEVLFKNDLVEKMNESHLRIKTSIQQKGQEMNQDRIKLFEGIWDCITPTKWISQMTSHELQITKENIKHMEIFANHCIKYQYNVNETIFLLRQVGIINKSLGNLQVAQEYLHLALSSAEQSHSKESIAYANILQDLALFYQESGNFSEAIQYFESSIKLKKSIFKKDDIALITSLRQLAVVKILVGDFVDAKDILRDALEQLRRSFPEANLEIALVLHSLGSALLQEREYEEGILYLNEALLMWKICYGDSQHPNIAASLHQLANGYDMVGNYHNAIQYYEKALLVTSQIYGEIHPQTAQTFANLGCTHLKSGNLKKAREYLEKSLVLFETIKYPTDHPNVQFAKENLKQLELLSGELFNRN